MNDIIDRKKHFKRNTACGRAFIDIARRSIYLNLAYNEIYYVFTSDNIVQSGHYVMQICPMYSYEEKRLATISHRIDAMAYSTDL